MSSALQLQLVIQAASNAKDVISTLLRDVARIKASVDDLNRTPVGTGAATGFKKVGDEAKSGAAAVNALIARTAALDSTMNVLGTSLKFVAGGFLALKSIQFLKGLADDAARTEVLGTVLKTVALNAGITSREIEDVDRKVQKLGITASASRQSLTQFIQNGLPIARAGELARAAQDLAVVAGENSSDTFQRLIVNITQLDTMGLRWMGIVVQADTAFKNYAKTIGKTASELSGLEKQQAFLNEVLVKSVALQGIYEKSLTNVAKQAASLARYQQELSVSAGTVLLPSYLALVEEFTLFLKQAKLVSDSMQQQGENAQVLAEGVRSVASSLREIAVLFVKFSDVIIPLVAAGVGVKVLRAGFLSATTAGGTLNLMFKGLQATAGFAVKAFDAMRVGLVATALRFTALQGAIAGFASVVGFIFSVPGAIVAAAIAAAALVLAFVFPDEVKAGWEWISEKVVAIGEAISDFATALPENLEIGVLKGKQLLNEFFTFIGARSEEESKRRNTAIEKEVAALNDLKKANQEVKDAQRAISAGENVGKTDTSEQAEFRNLLIEELDLMNQKQEAELKLRGLQEAGNRTEAEKQKLVIKEIDARLKVVQATKETELAAGKVTQEYNKQTAAQERLIAFINKQMQLQRRLIDDIAEARKQLGTDKFVFTPIGIETTEVNAGLAAINKLNDASDRRNEGYKKGAQDANDARAMELIKNTENVRAYQNIINNAATGLDFDNIERSIASKASKLGATTTEALKKAVKERRDKISINDLGLDVSKPAATGGGSKVDTVKAISEAIADAEKTAGEAQLSLEGARLQAAEALLRDSYDRREVTLEDYFQKEADFINQGANNEQAALKLEETLLRSRLAGLKGKDDGDERIRTTAQLNALAQKSLEIEENRALRLAQNTSAEKEALRTRTKLLTDLQLEVAASVGTTDALIAQSDAAIVESKREVLEVFATMAQSGDEAVKLAGQQGIRLVDALINLTKAKSNLAILREEMERNLAVSVRKVETERAILAVAVAQGQLTSVQRMEEENRITRENIRLLQQRKAEIQSTFAEAFKNATPSAEDKSKLDADMQQLDLQLLQLAASYKTVGDSIKENFTQSLASQYEGLLNRTKTLGQALKDLKSSIVGQFNKFIAEDLANQSVKLLVDITGGQGKSIFDFLGKSFTKRGETPATPLYTQSVDKLVNGITGRDGGSGFGGLFGLGLGASPVTDMSGLSPEFTELNDAFKGVTAVATDDAVNMFDAIGQSMKGGFASINEEVSSGGFGFGDFFKSISGFLSSAFESISGFFSGAGGGGGFGSLLSGALSFFGFAEGGLISGPGSGTSDSIPALVGGTTPIAVSNGEFITKEKQTRKWLPMLRAINEGALDHMLPALMPALNNQMPRFAEGGLVNVAPVAGTAASPSSQQALRVEVHPDALHLTLREWLEGELSRMHATGG